MKVFLYSPTCTEVRVRQVIPYLLEDIVGKPLLPPKVFTEKYQPVKYPYSITKSGAYSEFGLEMERKVLFEISNGYKDKFVGEGAESEMGCLSVKDKEKWLGPIDDSVKGAVNNLLTEFPPKSILRVASGVELQHSSTLSISGHPDVVIYLSEKEVVILDVKVFSKMGVSKAREIKAQLSLYAALARKSGLVCTKVGVIMPFSRTPALRIYDISKWKSEGLLAQAVLSADKVVNEPAHYFKWRLLLQKYNVGSHIHKDTALKLAEIKIDTPFQIFLYGNNPSATMEKKGRNEFNKVPALKFSHHNAFVHAPYNLNLASTESYVVPAAKAYLIDSARLGFKGVVFHVGHHIDREVGLSIMRNNITTILESAVSDTPFILETPCGNANELLSTPEEFSKFILSFPEALLGACLDTCHVFVSGYQPLQYLERLEEASYRVCLIHLNGSRKRFGCCADGHAHVTRMHNISDDQLIGILDYATRWGVHAVTE